MQQKTFDFKPVGLLLITTLLLVPVVDANVFDISLGFEVFGTWDDNILLMSEEEIDASSIDPIDEILQIHPDIKIDYISERLSVRMKYEIFKEWYLRDHPLDRTPRSYQDGNILATYRLTDRLTLGLYDRYRLSLYEAERPEIPDVRDDYRDNNFEPSIMYSDLDDRFSVKLKGSWRLKDYEEAPFALMRSDPGFADWQEYGLAANVSVRLRTRTDFLAGAGFWDRTYDVNEVADQADQKGFSVYSGISQMLGEGMTVSLQAMYHRQEYENDSDGVMDGLGGAISVTNQFSGITRLEIQAFSNFDVSERVSSAFYRNTGIRTVFYTRFSERMETSFLVSFSQLDYDNIDDPWKDDYFQAGVKLGYKVSEWLSVRGQYLYSQRESNSDRGDFENNLVSIYLQFRHNLLY